jgi:Holliday junction resolvasome RuvABC endonuclease subunit
MIGAFVAIMLSGCGHNVLSYSTGKYLNLGIDPGTNKLGIQYINGEQVTVVEKDNAKLSVETKDTLDTDGKKTTRISKIVYEIGEQTTGADVDLRQLE